MSGDQTQLVRRQTEDCRGCDISTKIGLVEMVNLGAQDGVPRQSATARDAEHQGNVAIRQRHDRKPHL